MKYLIIGNGFLGNIVAKHFNSFLWDRKINSYLDIKDLISTCMPEFVINCAGKTGMPNIDWCEDNKEETFFANVVLPTYIQKACSKFGCKMVHIGSGCTYQGDNDGQGYSEEQKPNFDGNYYAWTKILSEKYLSDFDVLQLRIRMPMHHDRHPRNLLFKILNYRKVVEAQNSITYVPDLLSALNALMKKNATGIYNVVNRGGITHGAILHHYEKIFDVKLNYELINIQELDKLTKVRRSNCVLSVDKLDNIGICMPSAIDAMERCMIEYKKSTGIFHD